MTYTVLALNPSIILAHRTLLLLHNEWLLQHIDDDGDEAMVWRASSMIFFTQVRIYVCRIYVSRGVSVIIVLCEQVSQVSAL
jgi:hypothetical protein